MRDLQNIYFSGTVKEMIKIHKAQDIGLAYLNTMDTQLLVKRGCLTTNAPGTFSTAELTTKGELHLLAQGLLEAYIQ